MVSQDHKTGPEVYNNSHNMHFHTLQQAAFWKMMLNLYIVVDIIRTKYLYHSSFTPCLVTIHRQTFINYMTISYNGHTHVWDI